jgi:hypothetical protein
VYRRGCFLLTNDMDQRVLVRRLERGVLAFFLLAALFLVVVYVAAPSIYAETLKIQPSGGERYPWTVTLFLVAILAFIAVLSVGVVRHWRWVFWILLIAFGFSVLEIPAGILQLSGVLPSSFPVWYSLCRIGVAVIEVVIAVWMWQVYRRYGVWGMGRKKIGLE